MSPRNAESVPRPRTTRRKTTQPRQSARPGVQDGGLPRLRTSERGTFKRCRWKWWHEFEELIKPITATPPLRFGSLVHTALAAYYPPGVKRGIHPSITFEREYQRELDELGTEFGMRVQREAEEDEVWVEARELGIAMLDAYVDEYGKDPQWEVLVTEQPFQQVVYKPWTVDPNYPTGAQQNAEPWFLYVGILDGIWRHRKTKKLHVVDHKTAASIQLGYLAMDDQATAYWTWGLDWIYDQALLAPNEKPAGMLFNFLRKALPDKRPKNAAGQFLNKDGSISLKQPPAYFHRQPIYRDWAERENARRRVIEEFSDIEEIRTSRAGYYKNPGQFTCPGCWLMDICELHEVGADFEEVKRQTTKSWEPYAPHEVYEGR